MTGEILFQASAGFITGYLVGLFIKAASRIILLAIGGFLAFLLLLQGLGWITINWLGITSSLKGLIEFLIGFGAGSAAYMLSVPTFGISFAAGVYTSYILPKESVKNSEKLKYVKRVK
jgi:uncharacterized membrane protein (Fun14 family)